MNRTTLENLADAQTLIASLTSRIEELEFQFKALKRRSYEEAMLQEKRLNNLDTAVR